MENLVIRNLERRLKRGSTAKIVEPSEADFRRIGANEEDAGDQERWRGIVGVSDGPGHKMKTFAIS